MQESAVQASPPEQPSQPGLSTGALLLRAFGAGLALLSASLLLGLVFSVRPPFEMFADRFTLLLPPKVFDWILTRLQFWSKPLLLLSLAGLWVFLGAAIASTSAMALRVLDWSKADWPKRLPLTAYAIAALAALIPMLLGGVVLSPLSGSGYFGTATFAGPVWTTIAWGLASLLYGAYLLWAFAEPLAAKAPPAPANAPNLPPRAIPRRDFMLLSTTAVMGAVGGYVLSRDVSGMLANAEGTAPSRDPKNTDLDVTPEEQFYIVSKNFVDPVLEEIDWRLEVGGQVERPLSLSLDEIKNLGAVRQYTTLVCISNEVGGDLISNALWTGIPASAIIEHAGPKADAAHFMTTAADGYTETMPLSEAMREEVLLVYELNGKPLNQKHGFPLRLIYPGHYGMKMTKWITKIELTRVLQPGYWEERGWDDAAIVRTMSRINFPKQENELPLGDITVRGIAFAGGRGISRVEISVDDERTWNSAVLRPPLSQYSWTLWSWVWKNPPQGFVRIFVRAEDGDGVPQERAREQTFPLGATGYHSVLVKVG